MKIWKKIAIGALAIVSALSMASCGDPTVEGILQRAQSKSQKIESMDYTLKADIEMAAEGQTLSMSLEGDATCFADPVRMKMEMALNMGMLGSQKIDVYAEEADGKLIVYSGTNGMWVKQEADSLTQYDGMSNMKMYLDNAASLTLEGEEELDSGAAYKISGVLSGDTIEQAVAATGVLDALGGQMGGEYGEMLKSMYSDMEDIPITIWVNKKESYPVKYYMDMTGMVEQMTKNLLGQMGMKPEDMAFEINKTAMEMEVKNVNKATEFEIPKEAKEASSVIGGADSKTSMLVK